MHEQTTIDIHEEEVPKLLYTLFCCKPVGSLNYSGGDVSQFGIWVLFFTKKLKQVHPKNKRICTEYAQSARLAGHVSEISRCAAKDPWFAGQNVWRSSKSFRVL